MISILFILLGGFVTAFGVRRYYRPPGEAYVRLSITGIPAVAVLRLDEDASRAAKPFRKSQSAYICYTDRDGEEHEDRLPFVDRKMHTGEEVSLYYDPSSPDQYVLVGAWRKREGAARGKVIPYGMALTVLGILIRLVFQV